MSLPRRAATVFASRAAIAAEQGPRAEQYAIPLDYPRIYKWTLNSQVAIDGVAVLGHSGGSIGRWIAVEGYPIASSTVANLPVADGTNAPVLVTDEAGGPVMAFDDGSKWRRSTDRVAVSVLPRTIIFNGQSNMAALPPVAIGFSYLTQYFGSNLLGWSDTAGAFAQIVDGSANAKANTGGSGTGPGPGAGQVGTLVMKRIADATGSTVRSFALAYPGQTIDYFLPASATKAFYENGTQHATLNNYNLLASYVTASGLTPDLYVFIQGEADANVDQTTYYTKLKSLFDATRALWPNIRWAIVGTLGGAGTKGVFRAQKQLADENPGVIYFIDNLDMYGVTAYWDDDGTNTHYRTAVGYEETGERIFAALQGRTREDVDPLAMDITRELTCQHDFYYVHSVDTGQVVGWQSPVSAKTMTGVGAACPQHVAYDARFGGRSIVDFVAANSETLNVALVEASNVWTVWVVAALDIATATKTLFEMFTGGSRWGFQIAGASNSEAIFYNGGSQTFTGTPGYNTDIHAYGFVVDGTNLVAKLYRDGILVSSIAIANSTMTNPTLFVGALAGAAQFFDGPFARITLARGVAMTDTQALRCYRGAKAEHKLAA